MAVSLRLVADWVNQNFSRSGYNNNILCLPFFNLATTCSRVCGLRASIWITRSLRLYVLRPADFGLVSEVVGIFGG